jgi:hypothetical protein
MPNPINQTKIIIIGLVGLCVVLLGSSVYFANQSNNLNNSKITNSSSQKAQVPSEELTPAAIPAGYPQKLAGLKRNSSDGVTFNLAQKYEIPFEQRNKDPKAKYTPTNFPNGYFSRTTNEFGDFTYSNDGYKIFTDSGYETLSTTVANGFILTKVEPKGATNKTQNTTVSHIYRNPNYDDSKKNTYKAGITTTGEFFQSIGTKTNNGLDNLIKENVVWFGTNNLPVDRKVFDHRHGIAIYNKNLNEKGLMGTYMRDYDNEIDTKISNQVCTNITFTQDNFICLNDYETLVNLNTGEEFGKYNQFIDTNDGNLYAKDVDNTMIYKVELNNPKNATNIYSVKAGETISHFSYTSQKELLVQVITSTPQSGILPPKITARTIELKNDGTVKERPEFKDVKIFI